jgi:hypothetical protein
MPSVEIQKPQGQDLCCHLCDEVVDEERKSTPVSGHIICSKCDDIILQDLLLLTSVKSEQGEQDIMKIVNIPSYPSLFDSVQARDPTLADALILLAIAEFGRFMVLNKTDRSGRLIPSLLVDQVWQAFILNTKAYALFCFETFSGKMLHRDPYDVDETKIERIERGQYTIKQYKDRFGVLPPVAIWPKNVFPRFSSSMEIGIVAPDGNEIKMVCSAATTIRQVEAKIQEEIGIPREKQHLMFEGTRLFYGCLRDYEIQEGDWIELTIA